jgi:hypothetical protein
MLNIDTLRGLLTTTASIINEQTTKITSRDIAMPFQFREFVFSPTNSLKIKKC